MRTAGIDLAAEQANTAIAVIEWLSQVARVVAAELPGADDAVLKHARQADRVSIDCPLGWPDTFVEFLNAHHEHQLLLTDTVPGASWRRSLAYRSTDEYVRSTLRITTLSIATDRIGITAMRAAHSKYCSPSGATPSTALAPGSSSRVYPAARLKHWGLPYRRYKTNNGRNSLSALVDQPQQTAPWLHLGEPANKPADAVAGSVIGGKPVGGPDRSEATAEIAARTRRPPDRVGVSSASFVEFRE